MIKDQIRRGGLQYISFIFLDLLCLVISNNIATRFYFNYGELQYTYSDHILVVIYMIVIDIFITVSFNTLDRVLRRRKRSEIVEALKHVIISMGILTLLLFSIKKGATFSRLTIYLAYGIYYFLFVISHIGWREILRMNQNRKPTPMALLITTAGYANDGLGVVENSGITVKGMFITDKTNEGLIRNIPVIVDRQDATAFICWEWIDNVYVCGPENIDVPEVLISACKQMGIPVYTSSSSKSFDYEVVKIRTALQKDDKHSGLSFFEGEIDIPFKISRFYTIFEGEQDNQTGFHAHKKSWHLLFCPYGAINVIVDTGRERKTISLDDPSIGLILHPSIWREMFWKIPGSVLCVSASGHYDSDRLRDDYNEYQKFLQEKEWSAVVESADIMGELML